MELAEGNRASRVILDVMEIQEGKEMNPRSVPTCQLFQEWNIFIAGQVEAFRET